MVKKKTKMMTGLAYYTTTIIILGIVALFSDINLGIDVVDNIWAIILSVPILIFSLKYNKEE